MIIMKNKIILLIITMVMSNPFAFAIQDTKAVPESQMQKELLDDFDEVNRYTDSLFTPVMKKVKVKNENPEQDKREANNNRNNTTPPVKRIRLMIKNRSVPKKAAVAEVVAPKNQTTLDCEYMEYFADRTELEANGHVVMFFPSNGSILKADKLVYNQTSNLIKAFGNVVIINDGKELLGDYMQVDMNEENALMNNPISDFNQIRAKAQKGYMYGDKIIQEQGSIYVTKKTMIDVRADMFGPDLDTLFVEQKDKGYFMKDSHGSKFKIKTNDIIINSKKEHDTVTLKQATIYLNGKKVGTIPAITVHTNKNRDYIEADYPEIGSMTNMGLYAGPGFVFDTPHGSTLKLLPILNYQSDSDNSENSKIGWGGIAKFKSATNKTDMGYGTANKVFLMRGLQKLDDNLDFQYASNAYMDDWFMGFRMPRLMGELVYKDSFVNKDFLAKDRDMLFSHRISGAYVQDGVAGLNGAKLGEDGVGTLRLKYMAEVAQTLYKFNDPYTSPLNARFDILSQASVGAYGTGDTQMIGRIGPRIHSQYKYWMQDVGYFLSAYNDNTPLKNFDPYMYGRSNVYMRESFRLCKYLTLSWLGSLNLSGDSPDGNMIQENSFYFGIGPDDIRLNIGYDTVRQQTFITMAMHLDAKDSSIEYKKMVIKNPDTVGKSKNKNQVIRDNTFVPSPGVYMDNANENVEKAEVINISQNEAI